MTKRERIDQDVLHRRAQVAVLSGVAAGEDVHDLMTAAAPSHVPGWSTPDVALLELAVTALDLACPAGAEPLEYEGLRERNLPEVTFRGRVEHRSSQYALYAAASMRGGLQPDLLSDAGWWHTPLWQYAVYAVVIYSRAAGERLAVPVEEVARQIAARHHLELPDAGSPTDGRSPPVTAITAPTSWTRQVGHFGTRHTRPPQRVLGGHAPCQVLPVAH